MMCRLSSTTVTVGLIPEVIARLISTVSLLLARKISAIQRKRNVF